MKRRLLVAVVVVVIAVGVAALRFARGVRREEAAPPQPAIAVIVLCESASRGEAMYPFPGSFVLLPTDDEQSCER